MSLMTTRNSNRGQMNLGIAEWHVTSLTVAETFFPLTIRDRALTVPMYQPEEATDCND
jgi:hypothetical protein